MILNYFNMEAEKGIWAKIINDARFYDGTPQMLTQLTEHFIKHYKVINPQSEPLKQSDIINSFLLKFNKTKVAADEFIAFQIEENDLVAYKVAWIDWSPDFWIEIGRLKNCS